MTSCNLSFLKALSPNTITLGGRVPTYAFRGDTVQSNGDDDDGDIDGRWL